MTVAYSTEKNLEIYHQDPLFDIDERYGVLSVFELQSYKLIQFGGVLRWHYNSVKKIAAVFNSF